MKERPIIMSGESVRAILAGQKTQTRRVLNPQPSVDGFWHANGVYGDTKGAFKKPYEPGDRLWVKEKYGYDNEGELVFPSDLEDDSVKEWTRLKLWENPMFMPKWFSRLTLKVIDARIERLQCISDSDCLAEGCDTLQDYQKLWDKLNAKRGFPWESNPWVWVIEFRQITGK